MLEFFNMNFLNIFMRKRCQSCNKKLAELFNYYSIDTEKSQEKSLKPILLCKNCLEKQHNEDLIKLSKKIKSVFSHNDPSKEKSDQNKTIEFE
jgi:hypothetical protein